MKKFHFYKQPDQMDCGPTCLRMVAKHYGKNFSLQQLREISGINREGVSLLGISEAAEKIGFRSIGSKVTLSQLSEMELPMILHWNQNHFVVLYRIKGRGRKSPPKSSPKGRTFYHVADLAKGLIKYNHDEFVKGWVSTYQNGES